MSGKNRRSLGTLVAAVAVLATAAILVSGALAQAADRTNVKPVRNSLSEQVRHELVMLPWYGVFDNLEYQIKDGNEVVLTGQVVLPVLKSDAGKVVSGIKGVGKVENQIEVLPLSPFDDRLRLATYRAVYHNDQLDRYSLEAVPPIHIIVKNGAVTLDGVVDTKMDKNIAGMMANEVPGVFSVTNDLIVENESGRSH